MTVLKVGRRGLPALFRARCITILSRCEGIGSAILPSGHEKSLGSPSPPTSKTVTKEDDKAKVPYGLNLGSPEYQSSHSAITRCKKDMQAMMSEATLKMQDGHLSAGMAIQKSVVGLTKQLDSLIAAGNNGHLTKEGRATMRAAIDKVSQQYALGIGESDAGSGGVSAEKPQPGPGQASGNTQVPYGLGLGSADYQNNHPATTNCKRLLQAIADEGNLATSGGDAARGMEIQNSVVALLKQLDSLIAQGNNGELTKNGEATMEASINKMAASYGLPI